MPLNEIRKYLHPETGNQIDSALEQAWQELKEDGPADLALARRRLARTTVALASTDPAKLTRFALHAARGMRVGALGDRKERRVCNNVR